MSLNESFMLHCGAKETTLAQVIDAETPKRTDTFVPIPHGQYQQLIRGSLERQGYQITDEFHALSPDQQRYFGGFEVVPPGHVLGSEGPEAEANLLKWKKQALVTGFRNGHGGRMSAGLVIGARMFVCDNLAFSGDISVTRKHTGQILDELPDLVAAGISMIPRAVDVIVSRFDSYQTTVIEPELADHIIMESMRRKLVPASRVKRVSDCYAKPPRDWLNGMYEQASLWNLFNAFTWAMKPSSPQKIIELPRRTMKLHELLDEYATGRRTEAEANEEWRETVEATIN